MYQFNRIKKDCKRNSLKNYFPHRFCNATISKRKKEIVVSNTLFIYGEAASKKIALKIADTIEQHWNYPNGKIEWNKESYTVRFSIQAIYFPSVLPKLIQSNRNQINHFIAIVPNIEKYGVSVMDGVNSNTGMYKLSNVGYEGASTEAHEYGHAIGLWPGTSDGHPTDLDQRGKGVPGIMYPRGTWVDPQYQYYPEVKPGENGGTVNPDKRKVRQLDIEMLGLQHRNWNNKGKERLGKLSSIFHASGEIV
jgi:hypothetical protein